MFDNITSICDTMYSEKTNEVAMTNNELKTFMNDLWGAEGDFVDTPLGRGRIENVRTKAGIDLEVMVKIPNIDGFTLFSGLELFEFDA
jgi:hypothetical protein|tara:strand:+ start:102 stop:365 length:264 start_codon:yes stop_codon:yes gene_type:complete